MFIYIYIYRISTCEYAPYFCSHPVATLHHFVVFSGAMPAPFLMEDQAWTRRRNDLTVLQNPGIIGVHTSYVYIYLYTYHIYIYIYIYT